MTELRFIQTYGRDARVNHIRVRFSFHSNPGTSWTEYFIDHAPWQTARQQADEFKRVMGLLCDITEVGIGTLPLPL